MTQPPDGFLPGWLWSMVKDDARNDALRRAIELTVKPGQIVLDLGAGSGLLAMFAVRAGAKRAYAVESNPVAVRSIRANVIANGMQDAIVVIDRDIGEVMLEDIGGERADLVISETIGSTLFDEGILAHMAHATAKLAKAGAKLIPSGVHLKAAFFDARLASRPALIAAPRTVQGIDIGAWLDVIDPAVLTWDGMIESDSPGVVAFDLSEYPMGKMPPFDARGAVRMPHDMRIDGAVLWGDWTLCKGVTLPTGPTAAATHWGQCIIRGDGRSVKADERVPFHYRILTERRSELLW